MRDRRSQVGLLPLGLNDPRAVSVAQSVALRSPPGGSCSPDVRLRVNHYHSLPTGLSASRLVFLDTAARVIFIKHKWGSDPPVCPSTENKTQNPYWDFYFIPTTSLATSPATFPCCHSTAVSPASCLFVEQSPQNLCTFCSLCQECSSSTLPVAWSHISFRSPVKCPLLRGILPLPQFYSAITLSGLKPLQM